MIFNTNKHKWHRTFLEVLNNHEIIYHMKHPRDNHYIIKQEYQNLVDRFGIHTETYKIIICPLMDYLQGYKKPIKGYRNYTKTDFNICYDLNGNRCDHSGIVTRSFRDCSLITE